MKHSAVNPAMYCRYIGVGEVQAVSSSHLLYITSRILAFSNTEQINCFVALHVSYYCYQLHPHFSPESNDTKTTQWNSAYLSSDELNYVIQ